MESRGRIVVITGSSSGIGKAFADAYRDRGAVVIGCSRDGKAGTEKVNVADMEQVERFLQKILKDHGRIDVLICNAGFASPVRSLEDVTREEFHESFAVNVLGVWNCIKAAIPSMKESNAGTIITVASRAGRRPHPGLTVYSASKAAAIAMSQGLAKELNDIQSKVTCFTVSPGGTDTPMRTSLFGEEDSSKQQSPETVAAIVLDLLDQKKLPSGADVVIAHGEVVEIKEL